jgi:hypothetical protein
MLATRLKGAGGVGGAALLDLTFYESRYGSNMGSVNVYVVNTSGNIQGSAVYSASGQDGELGGWAQRTAAAPEVSGNFRIAWHYVSGSGFRGDYAIDTVSLQGNSYNFDSSNDSFVRSSSNTSSSTLALSNSESVSTSTTAGKWNRDAFGTGSGSTGPTGAQSPSYYMYCETSGGGSPSINFWLFSPVITA